jgi:AcrR family transcriptional regulator
VPGRGDASPQDSIADTVDKDPVTALTTNAERKRPGRPPGTSDTRGRILECARDLFARNGIDKTSIRAIAKDAGVDPALVHHYFGTKTELFAAAIDAHIDPMDVLGPLREVPVEQIGYVLPSLLLPLWDSELGRGFIATLRSLLAGGEVSLLRFFLQDLITAEVGPRVDNPPGSGAIRVQFVASQLVGVMMARYILELDPFKSLPAEQIAQTIAPNLQRYLTGDLPGLT